MGWGKNWATAESAAPLRIGTGTPTTAQTPMHPDTMAALRLLVLSLEVHPEDLEVLMDYGHLPEHLNDAIEDHEPPPDGE